MGFGLHKLENKLRLALLGMAILSIGTFALTSLPILRGSIRDDRIKLFVESTTRVLAENVSHALERYRGQVHNLAGRLWLLQNPGERGPSQEILDALNETAHEPATLFPHGVFDLLVVVDPDGTIAFTNTEDRFGRPVETRPLWGRHLRDFPVEEQIWQSARKSTGKSDWYRSTLVAAIRPGPLNEDVCRGYAIAFAEPIAPDGRVLIGIVNWEAIQKILDRIEEPMKAAGFPSGYAFMFARDGDTIIAHHYRDPATRNLYETSVTRDHKLPGVVEAARAGVLSYRYEYPPGSPKVSGLARIDDPDFAWVVGLGINDSDVIAPVKTLTRWLGLVGAGLILLALGLSHDVSRRIAVDLMELTRSAKRIAEGYLGERVDVRSRDEVGQLATAFNQMTTALQRRDEVILQQQHQLMERLRMEQELQIAGEVQRRLFPQFRPLLRSIDYVGFCQPARGVSGDYYDFLPLGPDKLGLLLADVCGKGISAALLMASLHACVRTHAVRLGARCGEVISEVNSLLYESTNPDRFATVFYGVYDETTSTLAYVNAGHHPALLLRNGERAAARTAGEARPSRENAQDPGARQPTWLDFGTPPVGMFDSLPAVQETIQVLRGDWLVFYSDGILETTNDRGEEFGRNRLLQSVLDNRHETAGEMSEAILASLNRFSAGCPQADDRTLIVARFL